ncbi:epoxyqueuosine reductase QueH [Hespellia stercorisuis]
MDECIQQLQSENRIPRLLLHSCCAPCSSYVLEYLSEYFEITVFYYNPNIFPESEYNKRILEQQTLIGAMSFKNPVSFLAGNYEKEKFQELSRGLEYIPEGGERCFQCYELRLSQAAKAAAENGFDYFTTTLSISPMKNAQKLNEIGLECERQFGVKYLQSDFKKKNGYKRSIELSKEYGLYRQDYCGCVYSFRERQNAQDQKEKSPEKRPGTVK